MLKEIILTKSEFDNIARQFELLYEDTLEAVMLDYLTNFKDFLALKGIKYTKRIGRQLYYLINNK